MKTRRGAVFEVQVMTRRMLAWVLWNAKRVYKPRIPKTSPYFKRLAAYDQAVITYLNALDDGAARLPPYPSAEAGGILADDVFPAEDLR
ncbi:MAG: hypothetical protein HY075_01410 [Deltaproteobacteria bacterium]|nr:hypothetical protein [Deltaproteobacteria bacterium]